MWADISIQAVVTVVMALWGVAIGWGVVALLSMVL